MRELQSSILFHMLSTTHGMLREAWDLYIHKTTNLWGLSKKHRLLKDNCYMSASLYKVHEEKLFRTDRTRVSFSFPSFYLFYSIKTVLIYTQVHNSINKEATGPCARTFEKNVQCNWKKEYMSERGWEERGDARAPSNNY